jgi:hypothetical protein
MARPLSLYDGRLSSWRILQWSRKTPDCVLNHFGPWLSVRKDSGALKQEKLRKSGKREGEIMKREYNKYRKRKINKAQTQGNNCNKGHPFI